MNLTISGHHLEVTPALRSYVANKLDRIVRHFDQVVDVKVSDFGSALNLNPTQNSTTVVQPDTSQSSSSSTIVIPPSSGTTNGTGYGGIMQ